MQTAGIIIALTLFAVAVVPLMLWYYLWLDRVVMPRLLGLPTRAARSILALCIALPWIIAALVVCLVRA